MRGGNAIAGFCRSAQGLSNVAPAWPTQCLDCDRDGTNPYLYIADGSQTGLDILASFTFEAWVKFNGQQVYNAILAKGNYGAEIAYQFWYEYNSVLKVAISENGTSTDGNSTGAVLGLTWHHLAVAWDQAVDECQFYVDGVPDGVVQTFTPTAIYNSSADFLIGARNKTTSQYYMEGRISQARVWNVCRSAAEIAAGYKVTMPPSTPGLQGQWMLDGNANDSGPNGNNLSVGGTGATFVVDAPAQPS